MTKPPSHLVIVSPLGTERIESFPYSMQNMMGGNKLKKAREVEEVAISTVKGRFIADDSSIPSLDYTILKYGEVVDDAKILSKKEGGVRILPGDSLDGKVGVEMAANALLQSVAMRPNARNATMSVIGAMDKAGHGLPEEEWEDWFLRLDGPELWRSDIIVEGDDEAVIDRKFEELASYMSEWSDRFSNGAKGTGLTTPVTVSPSTFIGEDGVSISTLRQRYGVRLEFKQTNTGSSYKSKSEERELEQQRPAGAANANAGASKFKPLRQKKEGGVEIICEELSSGNGKFELRVRARRCNMDDATVVKELSEETILKRLGEAVEVWKKERV